MKVDIFFCKINEIMMVDFIKSGQKYNCVMFFCQNKQVKAEEDAAIHCDFC